MVKNEQDIIEPFVRHNIQLLDYLVILDNGSVDATRAILDQLSREFPNVIVTTDLSFDYKQSERVTRMLEACQPAFFADYVIALDADEFLHPVDRAAVLRELQCIPRLGCGKVLWRTHVLTPSTTREALADVPRSLEWRRTKELPEYRKSILRLDGSVPRDLVIGQGNHRVMSTVDREIATCELTGIALLHYPVRSREQLAGKSICGWMAYLAKDVQARQLNLAHQWREGFERVTNGVSLPQEELAERSFLYAQTPRAIEWTRDVECDPVPFTYARQYSDGRYSDPLALVARTWEQSLTERSALLDLKRPAPSSDETAQPVTAFTGEWHWEHLFVDVPPFQFLAERFQPRRVLDVGCGVGAYLKLFQQNGASILGIDGMPVTSTALNSGEYECRDLSKSFELDATYDMVICVEVIEHLDEQSEDLLLDSVARHADGVIIFSAAEPGQPGHGHINCKPISHWLSEWRKRGWVPDIASSLGMRALSTFSWFRRNLVVLRRETVAEGDTGSSILEDIAKRNYVWYGQQPGIRTTAFLEPAPAGGGYL